MSKIIVILGINKDKNNDNSYPQLTLLQNYLLMGIVDTPEKDLSNVEGKYDKRKLRTPSVNSYSILFSCLLHAMYNRVHRAQK